MPAPLAGLKVLDLSRMDPRAMCTVRERASPSRKITALRADQIIG